MTFAGLKDTRVSYDGKQDILRDLNISMEKGELVPLLGPGGCGKTTTLRVTTGLTKPNDGQFSVDQEELTKVPVHERSFEMVFQSCTLFLHLTIAGNMVFGLKLRKENKQTMDQKIAETLKVRGLESSGDRYPKQLPGDQRQRVALARALIIEPKLLLLDEPLSNLDAKLRVAMRAGIKRIQQQLGTTTVFVIRDQEECSSISDEVAIINNDVIEQYNLPETIYRLSRTKLVAELIGFENLFSVEKMEAGHHRTQTGRTVKTISPEPNVTATVAMVRPEDIEIVSEATTNTIVDTVATRTSSGKSYQHEVEIALDTLLANGTSEQLYETNEAIHLAFPAKKLVTLEK